MAVGRAGQSTRWSIVIDLFQLINQFAMDNFRIFCFFCTFAITVGLFSRWRDPSLAKLVRVIGQEWPVISIRETPDCSSDTSAISTCGCRGDRRGHHQNIVGFSLYGNFSDKGTHDRYIEAMENVADQVRLVYPGWVVRIYATAENSRILEKTFGSGRRNHVDICVVESVLDLSRSHLLKAHQLSPRVWRFLPLLDPMVDLFMSRDAESYIFEREVAAVQEWLNSSAAFHSMRDNINHCINLTFFIIVL